MKTVRSIKDQVIEESGASEHFELCKMSYELAQFWEKLNRLGARNIRDIPPETVSDIDATVELDDTEANQLLSEFRSLLSKV